jgi:hypothetical protein
MQILQKANYLMRYFKEISERKSFNMTLVLVHEISMKFSRKTNYVDPSFKNMFIS